MTDPIPPHVRRYAYLVYAVGSSVVAYLLAKGYIGEQEAILWSSIGGALGLTAAAHTRGR